MKHHDIEPGDFLKYVHDIDLSFMSKDTILRNELENLNLKKFIFTNGSKDHAVNITTHLGKAQKDKTYSFDKLNLFISKKIDSGDLLPLSLKKATTTVVIKKVNFDIDFRTKLIDGIAKSGKVEGGLWHAKNQKTSTGFQSWKTYPKDGLKREKLSKATGIPAQYGEPISKQELDKQIDQLKLIKESL